MDDFIKQERLKNQQKAEQKAKLQMHSDSLAQMQKMEVTTVKAFNSLVKYLDRRISKTEVVNQLKEIGTPDAFKVMSAVNDMHASLKKLKNTDLTEVTRLLQKLIDVSSEPNEYPEQREDVRVTNLDELSSDFKRLEAVIEKLASKEQPKPEVTVDAPVVNVEAPIVNVEQDFATLQKGLQDVVKAVREQVFPETKIDLSRVEKKLDTSNKLLEEIVKKPVGSGGSGGHTTPYQDATGKPVYVELTVDGKIPVEAGSTSTYESRNDTTTDTNLVYLGKALPGSATSDAAWQIKRYNKSAGTMTFADDVTTFTKTWDSRTSYTY